MPHTNTEPATGEVRLALAADYQKISECLGRAFHDDPLAEFFFPDEASRPRRFGAFIHVVMRELARHGRFVTTDPIHGAALWHAPSPPRAGLLSNLRMAARILWVAGSAFGRIASMGDATQPYHPHEPHWYLAVLGIEPGAQGRGIGSELLRGTLEECDRTGTLAYLESSKESNIPFYERHGFRVDADFSPPGGPKLWAMTRLPA